MKPQGAMDIALHDADKTNYPNLALMKLSAWHKSQGDNVSWFNPMFFRGDKVYSSKVFTYMPNDLYLPDDAIKAGSGYNLTDNLPDEIEHICPDYSLYGIDYSLGFLTRGCLRKCDFCIVPEKEGNIRAHADIGEFARHKDVVLMDNNVLACKHGIKQIEKIIELGLRVDFNQGIDIRLIDDSLARLLSKVKWISSLRIACDNSDQLEIIHNKIELLRWHNVTPIKYFCYMLVRDVPEALNRVKFLKGLGLELFAQPYRDIAGKLPTQVQRDFARWVNNKAIFNSCTWDEYKYNKSAKQLLV